MISNVILTVGRLAYPHEMNISFYSDSSRPITISIDGAVITNTYSQVGANNLTISLDSTKTYPNGVCVTEA